MTVQQENELIMSLIGRSSEAIAFGQVRQELSLEISDRTLKRRLSNLVASGDLIVVGKGRGIRYKLASSPVPRIPSDTESESAYIPISPDAQEIKLHVQQPSTQRRPVGYNQDFLYAYRPNETAYLSDTVRQHLQTIGGGHDGTRPAGTYARQILNRLLIDLSWNSSRLEGNTYSLIETERLINFGKAANGKNRIETRMILNHKAAIEFLVEMLGDAGFNRYTILNLHALLSNRLLGDQAACGRLRSIIVGIGGSVYLPLDIPQLIDQCFTQILDTAAAITNPFEQSFFVMVHWPYLQPFEDVNKRVSRLAANIPLIRENLSPLSFADVPERAYIDGMLGVYELNKIELLRDVFIWAYERSAYRYAAVRQNLVEPDPFQTKYDEQASHLVRQVVLNKQDKQTATQFVQDWAAQHISREDRVRFVEYVESELYSLHEGNIATHRLSPKEFLEWQLSWEK